LEIINNNLTFRIAAHRARLNERLSLIARATAGPLCVSLSDNATPHIYANGGEWRDGPSGDLICVMPAEISKSYNSFNNATFIAAARTGWEDSIKNELIALDALEECFNETEYGSPSSRAKRAAETALLTILDRAEAQP